MISLKKEVVSVSPHLSADKLPNIGIQDASIYSIIPVTMKETGKTLHAMVPEFVQKMGTSADAFDRAASGLLELAGEASAATRHAVEQYVQALETMMTGNLHWS